MHPPGFNDEKDEFVRSLFGYVDKLDESSKNVNDVFVRESIVLHLRLVKECIDELLREFQKTPDAPLESIGNRVNLSRGGLYFRFAWCGIDFPSELREPSAHLADFLPHNRVHGPLVQLVMRIEGDYLLLRDILEVADHASIFVDYEEVYGLKQKKPSHEEGL